MHKPRVDIVYVGTDGIELRMEYVEGSVNSKFAVWLSLRDMVNLEAELSKAVEYVKRNELDKHYPQIFPPLHVVE